jgi:molecular chaperone DnaK (HSP70)
MTVTVQPAHGLTQDEVERLVLESVEHAHADFTARRLIELQNKADAELRHTDKGLAAAGDGIAPVERQQVEAAIAAVTTARAGADPDRLQAALDRLAAATQPLAERLFNAVLTATLRGHTADEVTTDLVEKPKG